MERTTKRRSVVGSVAIALLLGGIAIPFGLFLLLSTTATVAGTASLPNGITARIDGPFSCSETANTTTIDAGGHSFTFSPTTISIDGVAVAPLDATVTDVQITASVWSATLLVNGQQVSAVKQ